MKDSDDKIVMVIIDAWSLRGTAIISKENLTIEHSSFDDRKVLISIIDDYSLIQFANEKYTFSTNSGNLCIICMEKNRSVRYDCGHGVVCDECNKGLFACSICRTVINVLNVETSVCFESYKY